MREVLDLDAAEFDGWLAFAAEQPFGPLRDDLRAGEIVSAVFGAQGVRVRPADVFSSLRPSRPRGPKPAGPLAGFVALCPALTPIVVT